MLQKITITPPGTSFQRARDDQDIRLTPAGSNLLQGWRHINLITTSLSSDARWSLRLGMFHEAYFCARLDTARRCHLASMPMPPALLGVHLRQPH